MYLLTTNEMNQMNDFINITGSSEWGAYYSLTVNVWDMETALESYLAIPPTFRPKAPAEFDLSKLERFYEEYKDPFQVKISGLGYQKLMSDLRIHVCIFFS
jgi:hypothetical protein